MGPLNWPSCQMLWFVLFHLVSTFSIDASICRYYLQVWQEGNKGLFRSNCLCWHSRSHLRLCILVALIVTMMAIQLLNPRIGHAINLSRSSNESGSVFTVTCTVANAYINAWASPIKRSAKVRLLFFAAAGEKAERKVWAYFYVHILNFHTILTGENSLVHVGGGPDRIPLDSSPAAMPSTTVNCKHLSVPTLSHPYASSPRLAYDSSHLYFSFFSISVPYITDPWHSF